LQKWTSETSTAQLNSPRCYLANISPTKTNDPRTDLNQALPHFGTLLHTQLIKGLLEERRLGIRVQDVDGYVYETGSLWGAVVFGENPNFDFRADRAV
jgi:hypothetical protein